MTAHTFSIFFETSEIPTHTILSKIRQPHLG